MRTETKTRELFTFDELGEQAKEKALDAMRYMNTDAGSDWWDGTYEDAANVGIKITGFDLGRAQECDGRIEDTEETARQIMKEHGEHCETYKTAAAYLKERDELVNTWPKDADEDLLDDKLQELGEEFTKSILEDYRIILQKEEEYQTSDEAIQETIEANEYEFTKDGSRA